MEGLSALQLQGNDSLLQVPMYRSGNTRKQRKAKGIHASSHGWCGAVAPTPNYPCLLGVASNQRPYTTSADMFSNSNFTAETDRLSTPGPSNLGGQAAAAW
jgi:hypothetical protein